MLPQDLPSVVLLLQWKHGRRPSRRVPRVHTVAMPCCGCAKCRHDQAIACIKLRCRRPIAFVNSPLARAMFAWTIYFIAKFRGSSVRRKEWFWFSHAASEQSNMKEYQELEKKTVCMIS